MSLPIIISLNNYQTKHESQMQITVYRYSTQNQCFCIVLNLVSLPILIKETVSWVLWLLNLQEIDSHKRENSVLLSKIKGNDFYHYDSFIILFILFFNFRLLLMCLKGNVTLLFLFPVFILFQFLYFKFKIKSNCSIFMYFFKYYYVIAAQKMKQCIVTSV